MQRLAETIRASRVLAFGQHKKLIGLVNGNSRTYRCIFNLYSSFYLISMFFDFYFVIFLKAS